MKFKPNSLYYIRFHDHSMDAKTDSLIVCEVFGRCLRDYPDRVIICSWDLISDDDSLVQDNQTRYTVIKSCIVKHKTLR